MHDESSNQYRSGYVAIVGRPNVGKSTLLNHLVKQKISITSRRPQTTRHTILGVHTLPHAQIVYVDTPGIHADGKRAMNRYMNRAATNMLEDVDVILFVVESLRWIREDEHVLAQLEKYPQPIFLVINKVDLIPKKEELLPWISELKGKADFRDIIIVSALRNDRLDLLEQEIIKALPKQENFFPEEQLTNRSLRFMAAEIVREKLTRSLSKELPYSLTVAIEQFKEEPGLISIGAVIWVERKGQKAIVVGKEGKQIKKIGQSARIDLEKLTGEKVYLQLWVKVREGWSDDERALRSLGYEEQR